MYEGAVPIFESRRNVLGLSSRIILQSDLRAAMPPCLRIAGMRLGQQNVWLGENA